MKAYKFKDEFTTALCAYLRSLPKELIKEIRDDNTEKPEKGRAEIQQAERCGVAGVFKNESTVESYGQGKKQ